MVCILLSIKEKSKRACLYGFKQFGNQLLPCFSKHTLTLVQTQCSVCPQITSCGVHWQADSLSPFRNTWKREAERDTEHSSKPGLSVLRGLPPALSRCCCLCCARSPPHSLSSPSFLVLTFFMSLDFCLLIFWTWAAAKLPVYLLSSLLLSALSPHF